MESCEWYDNSVKNLSKKIWYPDKSVTDNTNNFVPKWNKISIFNNNQPVLKKIKNTRIKNTTDSITRVKKINISFSSSQINVIKKWIKECDKVFNKGVYIFNNNKDIFTSAYQGLKLKIFEELYGNKSKPCPYDILTDEVKILCANIKSCFINLERGHIKHFEIGEKKQTNFRTILIPKTSITKNGIYPAILGKQKHDFDIKDIHGDCRLGINLENNETIFYMNILKETKKINNRESIVALDPGERIFQTFYSPEKCGKIGEDIRKPILKEELKIKQRQKILAKGLNKKGKKIRNKKNLKKKIKKSHDRINNLVKELHNQTALYLCKNYDTILIPSFETQKMVNDKNELKKKVRERIMEIKNNPNAVEIKENLKRYKRKRRLNGRVKFVLLRLSHYKFRQHLLAKSEEYGCRVKIVGEEYTSKCCGNCGKISEVYINRIKKCKECKKEINRDINGARNIYLKNYKLV